MGVSKAPTRNGINIESLVRRGKVGLPVHFPNGRTENEREGEREA